MYCKKIFSLATLILTLQFCFAAEAAPVKTPILGKVGLGFGIPYGFWGTGGEVGNSYIAYCFGVGHAIFVSELMWSVGAKAYFNDKNQKLRPNITLLFGTTGLYQLKDWVNAEGTLLGAGAYFNLDHDLGQIGSYIITYSIGFVTHEALPKNVSDDLAAAGAKEVDLGSPIKLSIGIGYRFGD